MAEKSWFNASLKGLFNSLFIYSKVQTWLIFSKAPFLGRMGELRVSITIACWEGNIHSVRTQVYNVRVIAFIVWDTYGERGLERVTAFLSDGKGGGACQTAELSPHSLPLQCVVRLPDRKLTNRTQTKLSILT